MSASTTPEAEGFWLDSARLAAHVIASEDELFGIDNEHEGGFAAAIAQRFRQAEEAGAIRGPANLEAVVYAIYGNALIVAVRESEASSAADPLRQVASYSLEARDVASPFDESFEECREAIGRLLEEANDLLPALFALQAIEALQGLGEELIMGWTAGALEGPFSSRAAIAFDLGEEFAGRVIATVRYGTVIYAAVRSVDGAEVFGLVMLAERRDGVLCTKPVGEDMGPAEDRCPARILDLLSEPVNGSARDWRRRCRARLARGRPRAGQRVRFERPLEFTDGSEHCILTWVGGSRFRDGDGRPYRVPNWQGLAYGLLEDG